MVKLKYIVQSYCGDNSIIKLNLNIKAMSKMKKCQVVMLPTNEKVNGCIAIDESHNKIELVWDNCEHEDYKYFHIYVLSDDEIKEGDWCILLDDYGTVMSKPQQYNDPSKQVLNNGLRKIIATTDISLLYSQERTERGKFENLSFEKGIHSANFKPTGISQPSLSFIQKYVEEYNKGNIIKDVLVEYEIKHQKLATGELIIGSSADYNLQLKVNSKDNTITIKKVKDSWSREEISEIVLEYHMYAFYKNPKQEDYERQRYGVKKWIEENL